MAKRFTETNIWEEDWFLDMPSNYQMLWFFIKDKCNHAGIWRPNLRLFEAIVGGNIDLKKAVEFFNKEKVRVEVLESGHWFLPDFFVFQYGTTFNMLNRVHKSIQVIYNQENIKLTSIRGLKDLKEGVKDKDKDKDKDIDNIEKEGVGEKTNSEIFPNFLNKEHFEKWSTENINQEYKEFLSRSSELKIDEVVKLIVKWKDMMINTSKIFEMNGLEAKTYLLNWIKKNKHKQPLKSTNSNKSVNSLWNNK